MGLTEIYTADLDSPPREVSKGGLGIVAYSPSGRGSSTKLAQISNAPRAQK